MQRKLFVLSMDAMVDKDLEYLEKKPNYSLLLGRGARVNRMMSIYPSITYPAHVSLITGCRTATHGVFNNTKFGFSAPYPDWHLYSEMIQVEDLFAAAKRAKMSTAAVYWPVTGRNPNIDYLLNEYFFYEPGERVSMEQVCACFATQGANQETEQIVRENFNRFPSEELSADTKITLAQTFDHFINGCVCSLIRRHQPDLLVAHNCYLDTLRHRHGVFHPYLDEGLDMTDLWLGEIIEAMREAGVFEQTDFILLSDHGQMNIARRIKLNHILAQRGMIEVAPDGSVRSWRAYAQSNGMSASIFVKDPKDESEVHKLLASLVDEGVWGVGALYTREEVAKTYGWSGSFSFVLETDGITAFSEGVSEPTSSFVDLTSYGTTKASHGYKPEKGPHPVFVATGPAFAEGARVEQASIIDVAPTLAHTFGQRMPQAEGRILTELLRQTSKPHRS